MTIDMHTHYIPEPMVKAFRDRRVAPWIETTGSGEEFLHMPVGSLAFGSEYFDMDARIDFMDQRGIDKQLLSFPGLFGLDSLPADDPGAES